MFVGLLVVVLGGAGGYGSWWLTSRYAGQLAGSPTTTATATAEPIQSATARPTEFRYDADLVRVGDCLVNRAPEGADPDMWVVPCGRPGSYKVVKIVPAQDIPADMRDTLHLKETAQKLYELLCQDVSANAWYSVNSPNDAKDHFLCMEIAPEV